VITAADGIPLVVKTTPANVPDGAMAISMLDAIPPIPGPRGRPRFRPDIFQGDRAYGWDDNIAATQARGVKSQLARPQDHTHGSGLGKTRYVAERTVSWFSQYRRLKVCYEKTGAHFQAFHHLAAALICGKKLTHLNKRF
jgi:transposase